MTRRQIADTASEAILRLTRLKAKYGLISKDMAQAGEWRIEAAREMMHHMDEMLVKGYLPEELPRLKPIVDEINASPVSEKRELKLPVGWFKLKPIRSLWSLATKWR